MAAQFVVAVRYNGGEVASQVVDKDGLLEQLQGLAESDWNVGDTATVICLGA